MESFTHTPVALAVPAVTVTVTVVIHGAPLVAVELDPPAKAPPVELLFEPMDVEFPPAPIEVELPLEPIEVELLFESIEVELPAESVEVELPAEPYIEVAADEMSEPDRNPELEFKLPPDDTVAFPEFTLPDPMAGGTG